MRTNINIHFKINERAPLWQNPNNSPISSRFTIVRSWRRVDYIKVLNWLPGDDNNATTCLSPNRPPRTTSRCPENIDDCVSQSTSCRLLRKFYSSLHSTSCSLVAQSFTCWSARRYFKNTLSLAWFPTDNSHSPFPHLTELDRHSSCLPQIIPHRHSSPTRVFWHQQASALQLLKQ